MATKKISELTEVTSPISTDVFPIVNDGETKKVQLTNVKTVLGIDGLDTRVDNVESDVSNLDTRIDGLVTNTTNSSTTDTYSCDYINKLHTYSSEEQLVGNWYEYKLYRKVVMFGSLPNATNKSVAHNISNLGTIVNIEGRASNETNFFPLPYIPSNIAQGISYFVDKTNINITTGNDRSDYLGYITLYYTKTTD